MAYLIKKVEAANSFDGNFANPMWNNAKVGKLESVRPESSSHRPSVEFKLMYDDAGLYIRFDLQDQYVLVTHDKFQSSVCQDSCVEFFFAPKGVKGYFNFEFNAGGTFLAYNVVDYARTPTGFKEYYPLTIEAVKNVKIYHTLPKIVNPEITEPINWSLMAFIPYSALGLDHKVTSKEVWTANFFKCADKCSHPHWLSYHAVPELNFHLPKCFGEIIFE